MDGSTFVITVPQSAAPGRQVLSKMFGIANDEYRHKKEDPTCFQLYDSEFDEDSMKNIPRFAREAFRYSILLIHTGKMQYNNII